MENWKNYFQGKKVTVMGLGVLGRGIADTRFLVEAGAEVTVTDLKSEEELAPALAELKDLKIKYVLGKHNDEDFIDADFILKNAAVPPYSEHLQLARENNIPIEMDESLFAKLMPAGVEIVGITGTRGKTSTTYLVYELLQLLKKRRIFLAGNVQGKATLPLIKEVEAGDIVVLELSSWQLQGFSEALLSPHIGLWTNLYPDHLNYYKGSMEAYADDKKNIYRYQTAEDFFIYNADDEFLLNLLSEVKADKLPFSASEIDDSWNLKILGLHNKANIAAALKVGQIYGLDYAKMKKTIEKFSGVAYRLEYRGEKNHVKFYNDTTSTTPVAALKALEAFPPEQELVLIAGGADKNLDLSEWVDYLITRVDKIVLLQGSGTEILKNLLEERGASSIIKGEHDNLSAALAQAIDLATENSVVLFSPGFASFGMFKNEYDRGERFDNLLNDYLAN